MTGLDSDEGWKEHTEHNHSRHVLRAWSTRGVRCLPFTLRPMHDWSMTVLYYQAASKGPLNALHKRFAPRGDGYSLPSSFFALCVGQPTDFLRVAILPSCCGQNSPSAATYRIGLCIHKGSRLNGRGINWKFTLMEGSSKKWKK